MICRGTQKQISTPVPSIVIHIFSAFYHKAPMFAFSLSSVISLRSPFPPITSTSCPNNNLSVDKPAPLIPSSRFIGARLHPSFYSRFPRLAKHLSHSRSHSHSQSPSLPATTTNPPPAPFTQTTIQCYADGPDGDAGGDDDDDDYSDEPDVLLKEDSSGRTLPVGIQCIVPYDDVEYYVCYPMDDPVAFVRSDDNSGSLEPIEEQSLIDQLFPNAAAVLAETNLHLLNTPYVLTLSDYSEDALDEDDDEIEDEKEHLLDEAEMSVGDDRDVEVVAEFSSEGKDYLVVRPLEEVLIVAKTIDGMNFSVLNGSELSKVSPIIEDYIERERKETERTILES